MSQQRDRPRIRHRRRRSPSRPPFVEMMEDRLLLASSPFTVTNTSDAGPGTLRQAIIDANASIGPDSIQFAIPASTAPQLDVAVPGFDPVTQTWRIQLASALPAITDQVSIDGYTQAHSPVSFRYPSAISSAVQSIAVVGEPTGGSFTLTTSAPLPVRTTAPIPFDASSATVLARLNEILGVGNIFITGGPAPAAPFTITFIGAYARRPIPDLVATSALTGGLGAGVTVTTETVGGVTVADPTPITSVPNSVSAKEGNDAQARVIVDGRSTNGATGFAIATSHSSLRGLIIDGFGVGVAIPSPGNVGNLVQGNFIGQHLLYQVDATTGSPLTSNRVILAGAGNSLQGLLLGSTNATIGGVAPQDNNVIAGNGLQGVSILAGAEGNQVLGNQIGIVGPGLGGRFAIAGNSAEGVLIAASSNTVGGATTGAGNLISGNVGDGVRITGVAVTRNRVEGNYIGIGPGGGFLFGATEPGNLGNGVLIENASDNRIGGSNEVQRNVISANKGVGVKIIGATATGNALLNNYIGPTAGGISVLGNEGEGVAIFSANNVIGAGNVISGNRRGVLISGPVATGNRVQGNLIGTDSTGQADLGNALEGVRIEDATDNLIVGDANGSQVISGNRDGVTIVGATSTRNTVQGNLIGTDKTGTFSLGNSQVGAFIDSAPGNTIGGTSAVTRNLISANHWGVIISGATARNNLVQGNFVGTDITGTLSLGNDLDGVLITQGASNNAIGGTAVGAGNAIAYNVGNGVNLLSGTGNAILSNRIYGNNLLGIDLGGNGVNPYNPAGGAGPNDLQNYPLLTAVSAGGTGTSIQGLLQSLPNTRFLIEFFSNTATTRTGYGPGETPIGSITVTTDAGGNAPIAASIAAIVPRDVLISATATNVNTGDTSEFSLVALSTPVMVRFAANSYAIDQESGTITIGVQRAGNPGSLVTVNYATGGGSAREGTNYRASSGTLTFNPNELNKSFTVALIDTNTVGPNTTVDLFLTDPTGGATLGTPNPVTLTIQNSNRLTTQFAATGFTVDERGGNATITVTRNSGGTTSTVDYVTAGGSASPGVNYTSTAGTLTFNPGQTSKTFTIPVRRDNQVTGPLTVGIALANPGGGFLGDPGTAVLTISDVDSPGALQVGASTLSVSPGAGSATVTVLRVGGAGGTVSVSYATGGGSAVPGTDYSPVSGLLTFNPGETRKTITVPIANNPAGGNKQFGLTLSNPNGGATLGAPVAVVITISPGGDAGNPTGPDPGGSNPNTIGPLINDLHLLNDGRSITGIALSFDRPLDLARAQDVANYGYVIREPGNDRVLGSFDDGLVAIASAVYDPATNRVTLTPATPLPMGVSYQIAINQNASAATGAGVADTSGALLNAGGTGGPYVAQFSLGTRLSYADRNGDVVSLRLTRGGLLELRRGADGEAQQLRIVNAVRNRSTLKGNVRRGGRGSDGRTSLPILLGAGGVKTSLRAFNAGGRGRS